MESNGLTGWRPFVEENERQASWQVGLTGTRAEGMERSRKREVVISAMFERAGLIGGAGEIS